jgi:hypothetical protein
LRKGHAPPSLLQNSLCNGTQLEARPARLS